MTTVCISADASCGAAVNGSLTLFGELKNRSWSKKTIRERLCAWSQDALADRKSPHKMEAIDCPPLSLSCGRCRI